LAGSGSPQPTEHHSRERVASTTSAWCGDLRPDNLLNQRESVVVLVNRLRHAANKVAGMTVVVRIVHAGLAAAWVGGMSYSLFVVQPKVKKYFGENREGREELTAVIASGNRWKVLGLIAAIALTGVILLVIEREHRWIHAVKAILLLAASGIFWYVSWRHWPRRVFATGEELPALQRQLVILAGTMLALTGTAFALGVLAAHV